MSAKYYSNLFRINGITGCVGVSDSVHAERLSGSVLRSVVDLLWNQLHSMSCLVMNDGDDVSRKPIDDSNALSSDGSVDPAVSTEARMQCK